MTSDESNTPPSLLAGPMSGWWLLGPILALVIGAFALVTVAVGLAGVGIDRTAIAGSQRLADSGLRMLQHEIRLLAKDYAFWDAALEKLIVTPDPEWAAANVGQYIVSTFGVTATIAIDANDRIAYFAYDNLRAAPPARFAEAVVAALGPAIEKARAAPPEEPVGVSEFIDVSGRLILVGAAAMTAQRAAEGRQQPHKRPVLLFLREMDDAVFTDLQQRFNLFGLHLVRDPDAASSHAIPIGGPHGEAIGWVDWVPEQPGGTLIGWIVWPLAAIGVIVVALSWLVLRRAVQAHHELHGQARALRLANEQLSANAAQVRSALQRAEHATRAKSGFLAGISHELRTPLTAIIGFSQILKLQHRPGKTKSREQEYAEIIHDSSQHLLNLVNDILDLSKIESGGYELEERWIDLGREAKTVQSLLTQDAERRGVSLSIEVTEGLPALYADPKSIRQILINLLGNALKFTDRGGWVRLVLRPNADEGLLVEVSDNGTGIAPEDQVEIWEAFKRARGPGLSTVEGSGLGLHLVKVLAGLHGADVGLESVLGEGTRVWVAFGAERVRAIAA